MVSGGSDSSRQQDRRPPHSPARATCRNGTSSRNCTLPRVPPKAAVARAANPSPRPVRGRRISRFPALSPGHSGGGMSPMVASASSLTGAGCSTGACGSGNRPMTCPPFPEHPAVPTSNPVSGNPASAAFIAANRFFPSSSKFMSAVCPPLPLPSPRMRNVHWPMQKGHFFALFRLSWKIVRFHAPSPLAWIPPFPTFSPFSVLPFVRQPCLPESLQNRRFLPWARLQRRRCCPMERRQSHRDSSRKSVHLRSKMPTPPACRSPHGSAIRRQSATLAGEKTANEGRRPLWGWRPPGKETGNRWWSSPKRVSATAGSRA